MPNTLSFAVDHPDLIIRMLETMRKSDQMSVDRFCNITGINRRTYEAWLSSRRIPSVDQLRWVTVRDANRTLLGVLKKLEEYQSPVTNGPRYYAVAIHPSGRIDAGDGQSSFDAVVNAAVKAAGLSGISNSSCSIRFEREFPCVSQGGPMSREEILKTALEQINSGPGTLIQPRQIRLLDGTEFRGIATRIGCQDTTVWVDVHAVDVGTTGRYRADMIERIT